MSFEGKTRRRGVEKTRVDERDAVCSRCECLEVEV